MCSTILFVAAADRGHFAWCLPLARRAQAAGFRCELWTHACAVAWLPTGHPFHGVVPALGSGVPLGALTAAYKWAVSVGDTDAAGQEAAFSGDAAGFQRGQRRFGLDPDASNDLADFMASPSARVALRNRLAKGGGKRRGKNRGKRVKRKQRRGRRSMTAKPRAKRKGQSPVVGCVWEKTWCAWVANACADAGIPSVGVHPTFVDVFRGAAQVPTWGFDGVCRVRDRVTDIAPPLVPTPSRHAQLPSASPPIVHVLAGCLCAGIDLPPGRLRVGALLLDLTSSLSSTFDPSKKSDLAELADWLDGAGVAEAAVDVCLVALGSQSTLHSISPSAQTDLVLGTLRACPRVLIAGTSSQALREHKDPRVAQAVREKRVLGMTWIPQWEVLGHRHVRCFVSHCGANGLHEAFARGVAVVPLPFFDDQLYLATRVEGLLYSRKGPGALADYRAVRKAVLRHGGEVALTTVADAVHHARAVPQAKLQELALSVRKEAGVNVLFNILQDQMDYRWLRRNRQVSATQTT